MSIIVIDPGHGGRAAAGRSSPLGACGRLGTLEKDVTLQLAKRVAARLGGRATLTRREDVNLSLAERVRMARQWGAGVFLSLHANAGPPGAHGAEAWVHPHAGASSRALANALGRELGRIGGGALVQTGEL